MTPPNKLALTPELVYLKPLTPGPISMAPSQVGGLALNFVGDGNYFSWVADLPVRLQRNVQLSRPFTANTVVFQIAAQLTNGGIGPPSPGALTASASLSTVLNGVAFSYNSLNLSGYSFNGNTSNYEFQGIAQPPVPIGVDLLSSWPNLHVVIGIQLPCPCIETNGAPDGSAANPTLLTATPTQPFDTAVLLYGEP